MCVSFNWFWVSVSFFPWLVPVSSFTVVFFPCLFGQILNAFCFVLIFSVVVVVSLAICIEFLVKKCPKEQTEDEKFDRDTPLALHVHTKRKNTPNRVLSLCRRRRSLLWCRLEELVNTSGKCG